MQCLSIHKCSALHRNEYDVAKILTSKKELTIIVHVVVKLLLHTKGKTRNQSLDKASFTELFHDDIGSHNGTEDIRVELTLFTDVHGGLMRLKSKRVLLDQ